MNFDEFLNSNNVIKKHKGSTIEYENLTNIIGKDVWVCDYRNSDKGIDMKPIRNIKPTLVRVVENDNKYNVYYSDVHFRTIKSNGEISSEVIAPYDNTGYRWYAGVSLNIFYTEKECVDFFNIQIKTALSYILSEKEKFDKRIQYKLDKLNEMIK